MPSNFANSGIDPAFFTASALQSASTGMPTGLMSRRTGDSTAVLTISFQVAGEVSAVNAADVIATI